VEGGRPAAHHRTLPGGRATAPHISASDKLGMSPFPTDYKTRDRILARYFKVPSLDGDNRPIIRRFLWGSVWAAILTPALFYLRSGKVDWFAISCTIFLVVACWLYALGFHFRSRKEYHTRVPMEWTLPDRIGSLWLVACGLGPFFGWLITSFGVTESSWRWQYLARAFLSVILPVITAIPLLTYARGRAALIAVPWLLVITALPIFSCLWVLSDMRSGAETVVVEVWRDPATGRRDCVSEPPSTITCNELRGELTGAPLRITWLPHTRRILSKERLSPATSSHSRENKR